MAVPCQSVDSPTCLGTTAAGTHPAAEQGRAMRQAGYAGGHSSSNGLHVELCFAKAGVMKEGETDTQDSRPEPAAQALSDMPGVVPMPHGRLLWLPHTWHRLLPDIYNTNHRQGCSSKSPANQGTAALWLTLLKPVTTHDRGATLTQNQLATHQDTYTSRSTQSRGHHTYRSHHT